MAASRKRRFPSKPDSAPPAAASKRAKTGENAGETTAAAKLCCSDMGGNFDYSTIDLSDDDDAEDSDDMDITFY